MSQRETKDEKLARYELLAKGRTAEPPPERQETVGCPRSTDGMTAEEIVEGVLYSAAEGTGTAMSVDELRTIQTTLRSYARQGTVGYVVVEAVKVWETRADAERAATEWYLDGCEAYRHDAHARPTPPTVARVVVEDNAP